MIRFLLSWSAASAIGALIVLATGASLNVLELAGLAPFVAAGVVSFVFFVAAINGAPVSTATFTGVVAAVIIVTLPFVLLRVRREGRAAIGMVERPAGLSRAWIAVVVVLLIFAFASAWYWPPYGGDALTVWVLKGRNIRDGASIAASGTNAAGLFYPLNLPLQVAALWPALGREHISLVFTPYLVGLVLVAAGFLARNLRVGDAWLFAMLVVSTPILLGQASTAMSDIAFAFYYVASALMLVRALETGSMGASVLSALLLALAAWTRADGLLYLAINLTVVVVFGAWRRRPVHTAATAVLVPVLFFAVWQTWARYAESQGWGGHFEAAGTAALRALASGDVQWGAAGTIGQYFAERWVMLGLWGCAWLAFGAALLNASTWRPLRMMLATIVLNIAGLLFTYYAWVYYRPDALIWTLDAGFDRMATHFAPLLWIYTGLSLKRSCGTTLLNRRSFGEGG